jgi:hypothetical protein
MPDMASCLVTFVTGSPGPQSEPERISLPVADGRPPGLLTDPTGHHMGTWLLVERDEPGPLVYQRLAPERSHP